MKHTKQMYVVVNSNGTPLWTSLNLLPVEIKESEKKLGYTVQPVTVTIELN